VIYNWTNSTYRAYNWGKDPLMNWDDVHTQVMELSKSGDNKLRNAWEKAKKKGTQQAKRDFYYNIFLLDSKQRGKKGGKKVHFIGGKERAKALMRQIAADCISQANWMGPQDKPGKAPRD
jgi:hypothetical protein